MAATTSGGASAYLHYQQDVNGSLSIRQALAYNKGMHQVLKLIFAELEILIAVSELHKIEGSDSFGEVPLGDVL